MRRSRVTALALGSLLVLGAAQTAATAATAAPAHPAPAAKAKATTTTTKMYVTLYGALDNTPPGSTDIAYPVIHSSAGGTGTYSDPVTFATDKAELPVGTRVYYPYLKKYFIMEDDCTECDQDWTGQGPDGGPHYRHIDLWAGDSTDNAILACEDSLTQDGQVPVIVDPPSGEPVDTKPIFNTSTLQCYRP